MNKRDKIRGRVMKLSFSAVLKSTILTLCCNGLLVAQQQRLTFYNRSNEAVYAAIDTFSRTPLAKELIQVEEGKTFFIPPLSDDGIYFLNVRSGGENAIKEFILKITPSQKKMMLMRSKDIIGETAANALFNASPYSLDNVIEVTFLGGNSPSNPEIYFGVPKE